MKELWVDIRPWKKDLATTAIESGADVLVVEDAARVRETRQGHDRRPGWRPGAR